MNTKFWTSLTSTACEIARKAHAGQKRRDGVTDYIKHPEAVAERVHQRGGDEAAIATAWLHDVAEDTTITVEQLLHSGIPHDVVAAVLCLTKSDALSYSLYLERVKDNPIARQVKIADMLHNLSDSPTDKQIIKYAKGLQFLLT